MAGTLVPVRPPYRGLILTTNLHPVRHEPRARLGNIGWLRAAVLGANDGLLSTASLVLGVAAARASHGGIVTAGLAGLVAGAMSMATGEYVSVHTQADAEQAALALEQRELRAAPADELRELAAVYVARGLDPALAAQVAQALTRHGALEAHARDELGITAGMRARPLQAALASALSFSAGASLPLLVVVMLPVARLPMWIAATSLFSLALLGALAAQAGGAPVRQGAARVVFWGALSMAAAAGVGRLFGTAA